jgi:mono/diheme cytochrome c family protein
VLKKGHPMQTATPSSSLTDAQISDLSHFIWDRINNTLRGSPSFEPGDVLVGDPKAGEAYFNAEGRCSTCHSPAGDLAGYGKRFPPIEIQQRFVFPNTAGGRGRGRAAGPSRQQVTVTVTPPGGQAVTGPLISIDDFHVALRDANGEYKSWARTPALKVVKNDPLSAHVELLDRITDKQMHDVVAYLETLK